MGFLRELFKMNFSGWNAMMSTSKVFKASNEEKVSFQNMMLTPNDETVSAYIEALKSGMKALNNHYGSQSISSGMQMKYVNAYNVIKKTDSVSDDLKTELGRVLLALGIAVHMD